LVCLFFLSLTPAAESSEGCPSLLSTVFWPLSHSSTCDTIFGLKKTRFIKLQNLFLYQSNASKSTIKLISQRVYLRDEANLRKEVKE